MRNLSKNVLGLWLIGMGLGVGASAQAATGVGPYYAMPSWDQTLPAATRFIVLTNMNSEAVLDRETGLVWERSPPLSYYNRGSASGRCLNLNAGGRTGWRLPAVHELMSLVDRSVSPGPTLPSGHPFTNVQGGSSTGYSPYYWAATTGYVFVSFANGTVLNSSQDSYSVWAWCVRGGQGSEAQ